MLRLPIPMVTATNTKPRVGVPWRNAAEMTAHLAGHVEVIPDPAAALEHAILRAAPEDAVFATGSLYLIEDYRRGWATAHAARVSASTIPGSKH
jgi:UDP-N-acetylmuramyl tripeptide synthase